jgi:rhodanese-related sulfurtransferase
MKTRVLALTMILFASAGAFLGAQAMRNVPRISIDDVKSLMAKKQVLLIDVRDPQSFAEGHMPGAINVPFDFIPNHVDDWKKDKRLLVTYCA